MLTGDTDLLLYSFTVFIWDYYIGVIEQDFMLSNCNEHILQKIQLHDLDVKWSLILQNTLYYKELLHKICRTMQLKDSIMKFLQLNFVVCLVFYSEIEWDFMYNKQQIHVNLTANSTEKGS